MLKHVVLGCILIVTVYVGFNLIDDVSERWFGKTRNGINLRRLDYDTIRISWGTGSGVDLSPLGTLRFRGYMLETVLDHYGTQDSAGVLPPVSPENDVWMYIIDPTDMGMVVPAHYVNPKLDDPFNRMFHMIELGKGGDANSGRLTRLAAQSYIYLGYVVMNEADIVALGAALAERSRVNLNEDVVVDGRTLYRLRPDAERHFVDDAEDEAALSEARGRIPVMFESVNVDAGHPGDVMHVLYLDGHIEAIPFGERFPATQQFMDTFPPPDIKE